MFAICFDIDRDGADTHFIADVETLPDAEFFALAECRIRLNSDKIMLEYIDDLFYGVFDGIDCVGGVKIRSL